ncbi:uncharacterized protein MELLADRAFT_109781 [Melampsora larici-populina 98AG31]|uniref:Uncharacterized protein n=1 Tax=Melampsora larici-populina (strain 98AG31 / pathotype 3-4-7) TaxID=747676 RepID=F4RXM1_MELLP|nr:uncharacterized protein MELLADRAFT_109781 [Melampsora larici-populina 98AG31]EGG02747.1 hypothetical protein MELLADRAFT_109781 [Melampsora larici-populina 98AG31]
MSNMVLIVCVSDRPKKRGQKRTRSPPYSDDTQEGLHRTGNTQTNLHKASKIPETCTPIFERRSMFSPEISLWPMGSPEPIPPADEFRTLEGNKIKSILCVASRLKEMMPKQVSREHKLPADDCDPQGKVFRRLRKGIKLRFSFRFSDSRASDTE